LVRLVQSQGVAQSTWTTREVWCSCLTSLVVPKADAVAEAGRLVQRLPELWAAADLSERRQLALRVLDAVYVDIRQPNAPVTIKPKAAFAAVLAAGTTAPSLR